MSSAGTEDGVPAGAPDPADDEVQAASPIVPPAAFFALERGTATLAGTLVARVGQRWRLVATTALPAGADEGALRALLVDRVAAADPALGRIVGPDEAAIEALPVLAAEGSPTPGIAIVAATERTRVRAAAAAVAAGWRVVAGGSAERTDPLALTAAGTRPDVCAILAAIGDPPDGEERDLASELATVAGAIASRRPDLPVLLAGPLPAADARSVARNVEVRELPAPGGGTPAGEALRVALLAERTGPLGTRRALVAAAASLCRVLDLRIELLEIGLSGGLRVVVEPAAGPETPDVPGLSDDADAAASTPGAPRPPAPRAVRIRAMEVPAAALCAIDDAAALDRLDTWSTLALDRARLRDRIAELALAPWADLDGDGALLRAAALRAATERLLAASDPVLGHATPDLVVGVGGAWSAMPGPAAAHVLADVMRRPGVVQLAIDHARLLAPLGTIEDDEERDAVMADLVDDLLLPLGTVIMPRGLRANRPAGQLVLESDGGRSEVDLVAGGIALVDLPPGARGEVEITFRGTPDLGTRGRRFAMTVRGGLGGLLVDLRDVPLRLPERPDRRRELLATWERALWPDRDG